jgi:predicted AAA+ superfamily ATPase
MNGNAKFLQLSARNTQKSNIFAVRNQHAMALILRKNYLDELNTWRDKQVIKVITGIRRCGKSTLMSQYKNMLIESGVEPSQIQSLNFEELENEQYLEYHALYNHLKSNLIEGKMNYIFLDEVQMVKDFQKAIDSLFVKPNIDIYLTGSNAYMLSGEIATLVSGRYVEIKILPLSFDEFCQNRENKETEYRRYISKTSFPYILQMNTDDEVRTYLQDVYNSVVLKDIMKRGSIKDSDLLERLIRFLTDNIGNISSISSITNTLASSGRKVSDHTIDNYIDLMTKSYLFHKVNRYDVKGKEILRVGQKFYITDIGIRNMLLGIRENDLGHILENIVYLELIRRGYQVFIGKIGTKEIDFVCLKNGIITYYQVALTVRDSETLKRELEPLEKVKDHYQKILLTLDNDPTILHNGIQQIYALDWLLDN